MLDPLIVCGVATFVGWVLAQCAARFAFARKLPCATVERISYGGVTRACMPVGGVILAFAFVCFSIPLGILGMVPMAGSTLFLTGFALGFVNVPHILRGGAFPAARVRSTRRARCRIWCCPVTYLEATVDGGRSCTGNSSRPFCPGPARRRCISGDRSWRSKWSARAEHRWGDGGPPPPAPFSTALDAWWKRRSGGGWRDRVFGLALLAAWFWSGAFAVVELCLG